MAWRERGLVPDCLGWLRVVGGPVKALGCKLWRGIELALLRFPIGARLAARNARREGGRP